jgi:hypothetical protein
VTADPPEPVADDGPAIDDELDELVSRADLDGLVRLVDVRCDQRDWAGLLRVRDRSRSAVRSGRQLWPAATLAEYRLALLAPADWAARVLDEGSGRFTLGPLTEVIAQHHSWAELAPHLPGGPRSSLVAHERVLRGEVLTPDDVAGLPNALELPYSLADWEPAYPLADYTDAGASFPTPPLPLSKAFGPVAPRRGADPVADDEVVTAVRQLLEPWTASSDGHAEVAVVEGDLADALGALGLPARARAAELSPADALAWLGWAGASGGAHGRRRGASVGRFGAWWTLTALGGLTDDWPLPDDELGALAHELRWWWWDASEPRLGWELQLAVVDPTEGLAVAISARDAA